MEAKAATRFKQIAEVWHANHSRGHFRTQFLVDEVFATGHRQVKHDRPCPEIDSLTILPSKGEI